MVLQVYLCLGVENFLMGLQLGISAYNVNFTHNYHIEIMFVA